MKYQDLRIEVRKPWNTKAIAMPIIFGSLGATSMYFEKHLSVIKEYLKQQDSSWQQLWQTNNNYIVYV